MKNHPTVNRLLINKFLKIVGTGLLNSVILLNAKQAAASSIVAQPPVIITKKVTAGITNLITLQFTTNLSFPTWQNLGTFSGSTNLSFTNLPLAFFRGVCSNLAGAVTLAWQPSADPTVIGYKIYYGTASHTYTTVIDVGNSTTTTISNLIEGKVYFFAATAYNTSDEESPFSNEINVVPQAPSFLLTIASP